MRRKKAGNRNSIQIALVLALLVFAATAVTSCKVTGSGAPGGDAPGNAVGPVVPGTVGTNAVVTAIAGSGTQDYLDGTGTAAQFYFPSGVAIDVSGNIIVADSQNNRIRKISPQGVVTTIAGGEEGYLDGNGTAARFKFPIGVAIDASGNIIVADVQNHRIRKITPQGDVTTIAGSGEAAHLDDNGTAAKFKDPTAVAIDASGNIIVADYLNHRIRKITSAGDVTTIAGSGDAACLDDNGTAAKFNGPAGVAIDASGNIIVAEEFNNRIRKITPAGDVTTIAGSGEAAHLDDNGTAAKFKDPTTVAIDASGNIIVADYLNHRIRKITPAGNVTTIAGSGDAAYLDDTGTAAKFNGPAGVAIDASGNIIVADQQNHIIRKITTN